MQRVQFFLLTLLLIGGSIPLVFSSNTLLIENSLGESFELGVDPDDRFLDVIAHIQSYFQQGALLDESQAASPLDMSSGLTFNRPQWDLIVSHAGLTVRSKQQFLRDYNTPPTKEQRDDIAFIVQTLAWDSWKEVWNKETKLEEAGKRIESVHPFNFLCVVFKSEKLTAGVSAIQERNVPSLTKRFNKGITDTLKEENARGNLLPYVEDFAKKLKISSKKISELLKSEKHEDFIKLLIQLKPREDAGHHNM